MMNTTMTTKTVPSTTVAANIDNTRILTAVYADMWGMQKEMLLKRLEHPGYRDEKLENAICMIDDIIEDAEDMYPCIDEATDMLHRMVGEVFGEREFDIGDKYTKDDITQLDDIFHKWMNLYR